MKSRLFHSEDCKIVETKVRNLINRSPDFLSEATAKSPRAAGDAIQSIVATSFEEILGDHCIEYSADFPRRAMPDMAFRDRDGLYYVVDVKTHRVGTTFNMPNLTSVDRLARLYEDDTKFFTLLLVSYEIQGVRARVTGVTFTPIEFLDWECLTIGALGWGQIQIANANRVKVNHGYSRKLWMLDLCRAMLAFYPKEIAKIGKRMSRFEKVREHWSAKADERV